MGIDLYELDAIRSYDKAIAALENYADKIIDEFLEAPEGQAYIRAHPEEEEYVGEWFLTVLELAYKTQVVTLPHITPLILENILTQSLPQQLTPDEAVEAVSVIPELKAFWSFLQRAYRLPSAPAILQSLAKLQTTFNILLHVGKVDLKQTARTPKAGQPNYSECFSSEDGEGSSLDSSSLIPAHLLTSAFSALEMETPMDGDGGDADINADLYEDDADANEDVNVDDEDRLHGRAMDQDIADNYEDEREDERYAHSSVPYTLSKRHSSPASRTPYSSPVVASPDLLESCVPSLSPEAIALLTDQPITPTTPGTILHDFQRLLEVIGDKGLAVSGKKKFIPMKSLSELNAQMADPVKLGLKRPLQNAYANIHGLCLVLRASGLGQIVSKGKKEWLVLNSALMASWHRFNPTEKYCTLLESWIVRSHPDMINENHQGGLEGERCLNGWLQCLKPQTMVIGQDIGYETLAEKMGPHNLALMQLFGLLEIESSDPVDGKGWQIQEIQKQAFGEALMTEIIRVYEANHRRWRSESEPTLSLNELQPALIPYFPEWEQYLTP